MLEVTKQIKSAMVAHSIAALPDEACGLMATSVMTTGAATAGTAGKSSSERESSSEHVRVDRFYPMSNAAESPHIYRLDSLEMIAVEKSADVDKLTIVGVMHSHTKTTNYPSPTDIADAARFDPFGVWHFVIVSLKHSDPSLRSFRILNGNVTEEPVLVRSKPLARSMSDG